MCNPTPSSSASWMQYHQQSRLFVEIPSAGIEPPRQITPSSAALHSPAWMQYDQSRLVGEIPSVGIEPPPHDAMQLPHLPKLNIFVQEWSGLFEMDELYEQFFTALTRMVSQIYPPPWYLVGHALPSLVQLVWGEALGSATNNWPSWRLEIQRIIIKAIISREVVHFAHALVQGVAPSSGRGWRLLTSYQRDLA